MASGLYDKGREGFLGADIDWNGATIKAALIDTGTYTPNLGTHQFMSDVSGIVSTPVALTTKTITAGVADADDVIFPAATGVSVEAVILYQSSAVGGGADVAAGSQRLIAYLDSAAVSGLPVTPNGTDIVLSWDNGANKIFKL